MLRLVEKMVGKEEAEEVGGLDEIHLRLLCGWTHGF